MTVLIRETEQGTVRKLSGVWVYLILCRRFPWIALKEIGGIVMIFAALFILLYVEEIARWAERLMP